jgi:tRNA G10  N-methylase Trm11
MQFAFHFGRTASLAEQELLNVAPILPFPWTPFSVSGELLVLKPTSDEVAWSPSNPARLRAAQSLMLPLQDRLGGTMRTLWLEGKVDRSELVEYLAQLARQMRESTAPNARSVGVSIWGDIDVHKFGIKLKRVLKEDQDWAARIILPQEGTVLTPAQLAGERLALIPRDDAPKGVEVVAIADKNQWWVGVTLTAANIDFYSARDFGIPAPDPVSGMLPPKLAQMMINLAVGSKKLHVHDPFCGNGRVVLEAALMGLPASGSDIVETKVVAAQKNLMWLAETAAFSATPEQVWTGDATDADNRERIIANAAPEYVLVGEPYLGKPLRAPLKPEESVAWLKELVPLFENYFQTWSEASLQPECHVLIMPRAKVSDGSEMAVFNAIVDRLHQVGYSAEVLFCYDRPDSIVRRDIVAIRKTQSQTH